MRALILHLNKWLCRAESQSTRIGECQAEAWLTFEDSTGEAPLKVENYVVEEMTECLAVFFQIEEGDTEEMARSLCRNLKNCAKQFRTRKVMLSPFAHLSSSRPDPNIAKSLSSLIVQICEEWNIHGDPGWEIQSSHFGWNKALELNTKGHPNAFKHWSR